MQNKKCLNAYIVFSGVSLLKVPYGMNNTYEEHLFANSIQVCRISTALEVHLAVSRTNLFCLSVHLLCQKLRSYGQFVLVMLHYTIYKLTFPRKLKTISQKNLSRNF